MRQPHIAARIKRGKKAFIYGCACMCVRTFCGCCKFRFKYAIVYIFVFVFVLYHCDMCLLCMFWYSLVFFLSFLHSLFYVCVSLSHYIPTHATHIVFVTHTRAYILLLYYYYWSDGWVKVDVCAFVMNVVLHRKISDLTFVGWLMCGIKNKKWIENRIATSFVQQDDMPAWMKRKKELAEQWTGGKSTKAKPIHTTTTIKKKWKRERKKFYSNFNELVIWT